MTDILRRSKTLINFKLRECASRLPSVFVVFVQWQLGTLNKSFFIYLFRKMFTHVKNVSCISHLLTISSLNI